MSYSREAPERTAQWHSLSDRRHTCVEHPGIVRNLDTAIASLGGHYQLAEFLNSQSEKKVIGLRIRPEDPFRRPIQSRQVRVQNVLLKVTIPKRTGRKRKRGSYEPWSDSDSGTWAANNPATDPKALMKSLRDNADRYQLEAAGPLDETYRFRNLPDFQYSMKDSPLVRSLRHNVMPFEYEKLKDFKLDTTSRGVQSNMDMIPPPSFAQLDIPFNYQYHQNPSVKLTVDDSGRQTSFNTAIPQRTITQLVSFDAKGVPSGPSPDLRLEHALDPHLQDVISQLRAMLEERPIITRRVVLNRISRNLEYDVKHAFQYVGYSFRSGPWKDALVKFGIDPRTDPEYRIYQTTTFKIAMRDNGQTKPSWDDERVKYRRSIKGESLDNSSHLFNGEKIVLDGKIWQCCDITDSLLRGLLDSSKLRNKCHIRNDGWYPNGTWAKYHVIMRDKIAIIMAGQKPVDVEYARLLGIPDDLDENNIQEAVFSGRVDATAKEVTLASEIRGLAKASIDMSSDTGARKRSGAVERGDLVRIGIDDEVGGEEPD